MWAVVGYDNGKVWRRSLRTPDRDTAERRFRDLKFETPGDSVADAVKLYLDEKVAAASHDSMLTVEYRIGIRHSDSRQVIPVK